MFEDYESGYAFGGLGNGFLGVILTQEHAYLLQAANHLYDIITYIYLQMVIFEKVLLL